MSGTNCVHFHFDTELLRKQLSESRAGHQKRFNPFCGPAATMRTKAESVPVHNSLWRRKRQITRIKKFCVWNIPGLALMARITVCAAPSHIEPPHGALRRFTL